MTLTLTPLLASVPKDDIVAHISTYATPNGKKYRVRWRDENKKQQKNEALPVSGMQLISSLNLKETFGQEPT